MLRKVVTTYTCVPQLYYFKVNFSRLPRNDKTDIYCFKEMTTYTHTHTQMNVHNIDLKRDFRPMVFWKNKIAKLVNFM